MPQCKRCQAHIAPFGPASRIRHGLIECLDCHCFCRNSYFTKIKHWNKCPKRTVKAVCYCENEESVADYRSDYDAGYHSDH